MIDEKLMEKVMCNDTLSSEERSQLEGWVDRSMHDDLASHLNDKWNEASEMVDVRVKDRMWERVSVEMGRFGTQMPQNKSRNLRAVMFRCLALAAACVVSVVLCSVIFTNKISSGAPCTISVERGQKANLTLPDGTNVWLNSSSTLSYSPTFGLADREVTLCGEGYFEVARNEKLPFKVTTNAIEVKVLGTSFNLKAYEDDDSVVTTVVSGQVEVSDKGNKTYELTPHDELTYSLDSKSFTKNYVEYAEESMLWSQNQMVFRNERLEDIGEVLSRMYNIDVVFVSDDAREHRFTGTIRNSSLLNVMEMLCLVAPIECDISGNVILIRQDQSRKDNYNE